MKKRKLAVVLATIGVTMACTATSYAGQWIQDAGKAANAGGVSNWWYQEDDGSYPANGWQVIDGVYYYFNESGWMLADTKTPDGYYVNAFGAWVEGVGIQNAKVEAAQEEVIQWFNNCYAILTKSNLNDIHQFGGEDKGSYGQARVTNGLESSWGITDRVSADETIQWLLAEGHRYSWAEEMEVLKYIGIDYMTDAEIIESLGEADGQLMIDMRNAYNAHGINGISAWDYSRAMQLAGWCYVADYYTYEEALNKSLEIAMITQSQFGSWDEFAESYLRGYEYWSGSPANYNARRKIYEGIKSSADNVYKLEWNIELKKTW